MSITPVELGRRIRAAREAAGWTQEQLAQRLQLSRPVVAQMELGNRAVSSLELDRVARLLGRDIASFLAPEFSEQDPVQALFRALPSTEDGALEESIRSCQRMGAALSQLESLLGISRSSVAVPSYSAPAPSNRWQAIQVGEQMAREERRRLGLGSAPVDDVVYLLENQGIRTGAVAMPDEISGLTLSHPQSGIFVAVNASHKALRRRFSLSHEYAHVLLDREAGSRISRSSERDNLLEVRANSFAACFLLPGEGVVEFLQQLGKGAPTRINIEVFDERDVLSVDTRTEAGSQEIRLHDVVLLAHHFGVSRTSALYRLRNLRQIDEPQLKHLLQLEASNRGRDLERFLQLPEPEKDSDPDANRRLLMLALEAWRREKISSSKFFELAREAGIPERQIENVLDAEENQENEIAHHPSIPRGW